MVRGHSSGELRIIVAQERQQLARQRAERVADINRLSREVAKIDARLGELDKADDLLNDAEGR